MKTAAAFLALLFAAATAFGQTATSSLTGRVTSSGAFAGDVTVTATSKALQHERTTVSTHRGRYWLTALPPGQYEVTFSKAGLQTLTKKVVLEAGRVARLDANIDPSEDEESITATGTTVSVTETTSPTTHYSDETLDRLPFRRSPITAVRLSPGTLGAGSFGIVDDSFSFSGGLDGQDALEQVTFIRAALPADSDDFYPPIFLARTRTGGEELFFSLRDTITSGAWIEDEPPGFHRGTEHLFEAAAGGRIIPEKLWFFADAWRGSEAMVGNHDGIEAKLTAQFGARHSLSAMHIGTEASSSFGLTTETHQTSLRWTGIGGPRVTTEAVISRTGFDQGSLGTSQDALFVKTSYVTGDHVLSAGVRAADRDRSSDSTALFANDRWSWGRATMNLGLRHDYDRLSPRVSASFDLRGNGRQAIAASVSDYSGEFGFVRELTAGFATAVGNTGSVRIDAVRRDYGDVDVEGLQADFMYSLFDRFHTGASYTWQRPDEEPRAGSPAHTVNAWAGVDLPFGDHEIGVTVVERYHSRVNEFLERDLATDVALRYSLPVSRTRLTLAADATNVFNDEGSPFSAGRALRGWIRLRM